MTDIIIGIDDTDHIAFFCPACQHQERVVAPMKAVKVQTQTVVVDARIPHKPKHDKCTWIHLKCGTCGLTGFRKFYWTCEDGEYCTDRTDGKSPNDGAEARDL